MQPFNAGPSHSNRDLIGRSHDIEQPSFTWPNGARVCLSFVINYEEGGENTLLHSAEEGDTHAESFLTENGVAPTVLPPLKERELSRESSYAYGSRQGLGRILRLFKRYGLKSTSWSVGKAIQLNPGAAKEMEESGCEVGSHSWRWINYAGMDEEKEKEHIERTLTTLQSSTSSSTTNPPLGWYTGRCSLSTRRLVYEAYAARGLQSQYYDNDAYDDDLPYYLSAPTTDGKGEPMLVIPYTLDVNDMKFGISPGFSTGRQFHEYLSDALRTLLQEAEQEGRSSILTVGLHCRIVGRPGRFAGLEGFVREVVGMQGGEGREKIWVASRGEIARFWREKFPPPQQKSV
ncbi:glycoside hydrolase/deacetylase [Jaminaea rosea]|uniref:Glycoside hydrolase/deacetylase n=1 Tax=Jaminaea rosea TaxID=1569628 RepID=A0A316ULM6_9BASI|nr:glycoside hydrolase/deacetylase [Jaminaea rosea]PWN26149.1 glycoside hydrolase/deacetylase [Jaminaea rosea]